MPLALTVAACFAAIAIGKVLFDRGYEGFGGSLYGLAGLLLALIACILIFTPP